MKPILIAIALLTIFVVLLSIKNSIEYFVNKKYSIEKFNQSEYINQNIEAYIENGDLKINFTFPDSITKIPKMTILMGLNKNNLNKLPTNNNELRKIISEKDFIPIPQIIKKNKVENQKISQPNGSSLDYSIFNITDSNEQFKTLVGFFVFGLIGPNNDYIFNGLKNGSQLKNLTSRQMNLTISQEYMDISKLMNKQIVILATLDGENEPSLIGLSNTIIVRSIPISSTPPVRVNPTQQQPVPISDSNNIWKKVTHKGDNNMTCNGGNIPNVSTKEICAQKLEEKRKANPDKYVFGTFLDLKDGRSFCRFGMDDNKTGSETHMKKCGNISVSDWSGCRDAATCWNTVLEPFNSKSPAPKPPPPTLPPPPPPTLPPPPPPTPPPPAPKKVNTGPRTIMINNNPINIKFQNLIQGQNPGYIKIKGNLSTFKEVINNIQIKAEKEGEPIPVFREVTNMKDYFTSNIGEYIDFIYGNENTINLIINEKVGFIDNLHMTLKAPLLENNTEEYSGYTLSVIIKSGQDTYIL